MSCTASPSGSDCVESGNPRRRGWCVRCAHRMPAKPEPVWRNIDLEREITYEACRGAVDPSQLIEHAEVRAQTLSGKYVDDSMKILLGRDRPREAREEAADARNHIVIHLQERPDDPLRDRYIIALRFFALAYSWLLPD